MMKPQVRYLTVTDDESGQRLDNYLMSRLKGLPRSALYKLIRKGEVRVNKGRAKPERKLLSGEQVRIPPVKLPQPTEIAVPSRQLGSLLESSILYEDKELLIVNKPSGLAVHGGSGVNLGMIEALRQLQPQNRFLELVHRLDRDTSGCVMVAKKRSMLKLLQEALRQRHGIRKTYVALVEGQWPSDVRIVKAPLKRILVGDERIVKVSAEGKASETRFTVLEQSARGAMVEAQPVTGRTHQIRVHALHVGCPLLGDPKYGEKQLNADVMQQLKSQKQARLFLHAAALHIRVPDRAPLEVAAPVPEVFDHAFGLLKNDK